MLSASGPGSLICGIAAWASGGSARHAGARHRTTAPLRGRRVIEAAATYIGIPLETLEQDLRAGKSLAQVATENGKPEAGLVQALATAATAGLESRLASAIKQPGGLTGQRRSGHRLREAAAAYLGLSAGELKLKLKTGLTLGQLADATPGHSREGLIDYLLAARRRSPNPLTKHKHGAKGADAGRLRQRITAFVDRSHIARTPSSPSAGATTGE